MKLIFPRYFYFGTMILFGCIGCGANRPATLARYKTFLGTYSQKNIKDAIADFGPPNSSITMPDGTFMYTWRRWNCLTTATTDAHGTILSWSTQGDNCVMNYSQDEIAQNLAEVKAKVATLSSGDSLHVVFYEGCTTTVIQQYLAPAELDGRFQKWNKFSNTITLDQGDTNGYALDCIEKIEKTPTSTTAPAPSPTPKPD